MMFKILD